MMEDDDRTVVSEDLVYEILKEVPAKSLLRFRCVTKLWCSIIDHPNFVHSHRARSYSRLDATHLLLVIESYFDPYVLSLYSVNPEGKSSPTLIDKMQRFLCTIPFQDLCYVHGLICWDNCIYNPSTRQTILLDPPVRGDSISFFCLGFDHSTELYKVLAITGSYSEQRYIYNVLTLGTNSWRNVGGPVSILPRYSCNKYNEMVYSNCANGVIFVLTFVLTFVHTWDYLNLRESLRLHAFEVGDEKFRVIALPQDFLSNSMLKFNNLHLLLADDCPAVMIIHDDMMTIWILEDYAEQIWKREHIQYPPQWQHNGSIQLPQEQWPAGEIATIPIGTIHKNKILFRSERERADEQKASFFYYDVQLMQDFNGHSTGGVPDSNPTIHTSGF